MLFIVDVGVYLYCLLRCLLRIKFRDEKRYKLIVYICINLMFWIGCDYSDGFEDIKLFEI